MKTLSREEIQRMVGRSNSRRNVAGNNQESSSQGFATPSWVDENYLSKSFFSTLFIIHATQTVTVTDDQGQPVGEPTVTEITLAPNLLPGTTSVTDSTTGYTTTTVIAITSIDATKNFSSDGGVSALGQSSGGGGGGATALTDLVDVAISNPSNGQVLKYNSTTNKWENANESGGGISMSDVWTALAASTSEQINASHFSDALNGYATQQWVGQQGFLTSSAISDMATKTWVGQQGYLTSSAISDMATKTWVGNQNYLTGITSSMVTTALGFTPLRNATTFWGSGVSNGVVNGSITMLNGTGNGIYQKDIGGTARRVLSMDGGSPSALYIGLDMLGYGRTFLRGNAISFTVGSSTDAAEFNSSGQLYLKQGTQGLRIGDALLTWDSMNKVLNLTNVTTGQVADFVASGGVSALGLSSEGNGGRIQNLTVTGTLTLGDTVIANKSPSIVRQGNDSDCLCLLNSHTDSKIYGQKYYYNQYDNVGLLGMDYTWNNTTWWIDPDGCALFRRVYLSNNVYLFTDESNIKVRIGSTVYTLTKS